MKKKILSALVCAAMVLSLAGCAENEEQPDDDDDKKHKKSESSYSESVNSPGESKPEESSSSSNLSSSSKPEDSKPEDSNPVDPIDWSTVPYADELDFLYEEVEGGVKITKYRGEENVIKIPETINGKTVVAFKDSNQIFSGFMRGISIPNGVTRIPKYFFATQYNLESVVLPDNYDNNGGYSFLSYSQSQNTVYTYLGKTYRMPEDQVKLQDAIYPGTGKILINDKGELVRVSISIKDVVIPDNVTSIRAYAFYNCYLIEDITIPGNITQIKNVVDYISGIFYNCPNLKSVTFAEGVTDIDGRIFWNCPKLETVTLPDSLTHLGEGSIYDDLKYLQVTYKGVTYKSNQFKDLYKAVNGN